MKEDLAIRLGRNIAEARKAVGKTQSEVAAKVEIETISLSRIERGKVTPGIATLDRIADALGVPLSRLLDGASFKTAALADNIAALLEPLGEADRMLLLEQMQTWAKRLSRK